MARSDKIILFGVFVVLCVSVFLLYNISSKRTETIQDSKPIQMFNDKFSDNHRVFSDGLKEPDSFTTYNLDSDGTGVANKSIYYKDINTDKIPDRITKTFVETGTAHSYYKYNIELKTNDEYTDITPKNLQTTNGDECDLQQVQFVFNPTFEIIVIRRDIGDIWNEPTMAYKQTYTLSKDNKIVASKPIKMKQVCDVKTLF